MRFLPHLFAVVGLLVPPASAHDGHQVVGQQIVDHAGEPGKLSQVQRVVTITAVDSVFEPKRVLVKAGETVRFIVRNQGALVHELTIGSKEIQAAHQYEMMSYALSGALEADKIDRARIGSHDHGNNVLLEPGQSGEIVWRFGRAAELEFGCNVPGHYEAGMKGDLSIE